MNQNTGVVLLVEDDEFDRTAVERVFEKCAFNHPLVTAGCVADAEQQLKQENVELILLDHYLPDGTGLSVQQKWPDVPCIFLTGSTDFATAVQAMKAGAYDFLVKDIQQEYLDLLPSVVRNVLARRRTELELEEYRAHLEQLVKQRTAELQQELSQRKRVESALRKSEHWLSTVMASIGDAVIACDTNGTISFINKMATNISGWSTDAAVGRPLEEVFRLLDERTDSPLEIPVGRTDG